jgi:hypothetical protein
VGYRERGGNAWCPTDSGLDPDGRAWVVSDGSVFVESSPGSKIFKGIPIPGPRDQIAMRRVKYRQGSFYSRNSKKIYLFNPGLKSWTQILESPRPFHDFEISPDGQIILIGVEGTSLEASRDGKRGAVSASAKEFRPLLEVWERFGKGPVETVMLDESDTNLSEWVERLPAYDRTWQIRDQILIYNSYTGRLGLFDLVNRKLTWIRTPWKGLTFEDLIEWDHKHLPALGTHRKPIEIGTFDAPGDRIAIFPNTWGLRVVFAPRVAQRPPSASGTPMGKAGDPSHAPKELMLELPVPETEKQELFQLRFGTLDLIEGKLETERSNVLEGLKDPIWFGDDENPVSLEKFLARQVEHPKHGGRSLESSSSKEAAKTHR